MNRIDVGAPLLHGKAIRDHGLRGILMRTRWCCCTTDCATLPGLLNVLNEKDEGVCNDCSTKAELSVAKVTRDSALVIRDVGTSILHYSM